MNKRHLLIGLVLVFYVIFANLNLAFAEVRINEVELNPTGDDSGNEWIELYSDTEVNLTDWIIASSNGRNMSFNASFSGFYSINTTTNLLTNDLNNLSLKNNGSITFSTGSLSDSSNDDQTWQYCSGNWSFVSSTRGLSNNCSQFTAQNSTNSSTNQTIQNSTTTNSSSTTISLNLNWTSADIINNEANDYFYIKVFAYNLNNSDYDLKVWLEFEENNTIISERYSEEESKWESGIYFVNNFFSDSGNVSKEIKLRIKKAYPNFSGEAKIFAKLRKNGQTDSIAEIEKTINIIFEEALNNISNESNSSSFNENNNSTENSSEENVIYLGKKSKTEDIKTPEMTLYKSNSEIIKQYAPWAFAGVCIIIIVMLLIDKRNK